MIVSLNFSLFSFSNRVETRRTDLPRLVFSFLSVPVDLLLRACDEVGTVLDLKHGKPEGGIWDVERVIAHAKELVLS